MQLYVQVALAEMDLEKFSLESSQSSLALRRPVYTYPSLRPAQRSFDGRTTICLASHLRNRPLGNGPLSWPHQLVGYLPFAWTTALEIVHTHLPPEAQVFLLDSCRSQCLFAHTHRCVLP